MSPSGGAEFCCTDDVNPQHCGCEAGTRYTGSGPECCCSGSEHIDASDEVRRCKAIKG
jgi:hypothetical protein